MTAAEALREVRRLARAGRVVLTRHARERMAQRGASANDVLEALSGARVCQAGPDQRWKVTGPDLDGDDLTAVVAIDDDVVVVTVF